ncbi:pimeloyl-ACP methyl ester carboxylesterase [Streptococcus rupicaprae]|uniref:Pimeloyl-ACP methyl ester carboxylesterase n=1 Tax=Streptococcus rupicaprae TaxID=759619 RepID=A0ABV2FIC2_9STRE
MKLIFLHGVGQDSRAWEQVMDGLQGYDCVSLNLFRHGKLPDFSSLQEQVRQAVRESEEDVVVIGLSLGGMLALSLLKDPEPQLRAVVSIAGQYQFTKNWAYKVQVALLKLLPPSLLAKQGLDKENLLAFYRDLAQLDMTGFLQTTTLPVLLLCGERDKINLRTAKQLKNLMPKAEMAVIAEAGHEVNKDQPLLLADRILAFVESISK